MELLKLLIYSILSAAHWYWYAPQKTALGNKFRRRRQRLWKELNEF